MTIWPTGELGKSRRITGASLRYAQRTYGTLFSRGPGFERQPPGLAFEADRVRGYFIDYRTKTEAKAARAPMSLLPGSLVQLALAWHERMLLGEIDAGARFIRTCELLIARAEDAGAMLLWPYDLPIRKYRLERTWYAGMTQGQAASALIRAYLHTGSSEYKSFAQRAIEPLLRCDNRFVSLTSAGPVLEEAEASPPSHILNGWIFALWGLWDSRLVLDEHRADELLTATLECLRQRLPEYDVGWWSRYSLFPHLLPDLAKPFYHRLHIHQMEVLHRLTGVTEFGATANRWRSYDSRLARCAALGQKVPFKVADALTRLPR